MLSYTGQLALIQSILNSLYTFWGQIFIFPKKIVREVDQWCRSFLWSGKEGITKKATVSWDRVCQPKACGGLNLRQILVWNKAALLKQLWMLALKKDSLLVKWVHTYYIKDGYLMVCKFPKCISWMLRKIVEMRYVVDEVGGFSSVATPLKFSVSKAYSKLLELAPKVYWEHLLIGNHFSPRSQYVVWLVCWRRLAIVDRLS